MTDIVTLEIPFSTHHKFHHGLQNSPNAEIIQTNTSIRSGGGPHRFVMQHQEERDIREQLARLRAEHRDLDSEIVALEGAGGADQLTVTRLKKRKLKLKDLITSLEDKLFPDIIA